MSVCVWNMGTDCAGEVSTELMFRGQLQVPVCGKHYNEHLKLSLLIKESGRDTEELLELTVEQRDEELAKALNGKDLNVALAEMRELENTRAAE